MKNADIDIQVLGPNSALEGSLVFEGRLIVNGHLNGTIESRSGEVVIGSGAIVQAEVFVRRAKISGEVRGAVFAGERIELHRPARVYADLTAPDVLIEPGVVFDGNCSTRSGGASELRPSPGETEETAAGTPPPAAETEVPRPLSGANPPRDALPA